MMRQYYPLHNYAHTGQKRPKPTPEELEARARLYVDLLGEPGHGWSTRMAQSKAGLKDSELQDLIARFHWVRFAYDRYCDYQRTPRSRRLSNLTRHL